VAPDRAARLAAFYDLDLRDDPGDLDLYLALADREGGPVLELGVGTGRLAVPLAAAGHAVTGVDDECLAAFRSHPWPGNVRQLRNVIERALILCQASTIRKGDLPEDFRAASGPDSAYLKVRLGSSLDEVEREMINRTLEFTGGNKTRAAQLLGVSAKTLYNRLGRSEPSQ